MVPEYFRKQRDFDPSQIKDPGELEAGMTVILHVGRNDPGPAKVLAVGDNSLRVHQPKQRPRNYRLYELELAPDPHGRWLHDGWVERVQ